MAFGIQLWRVAAGAGACLLGAGCMTLTPDPVAPTMGGTAARSDVVRSDVRELQEWRQDVRIEIENQTRENEALRRRLMEMEAASRAGEQTLSARVRDLELAREKDRQFIVDELTRRILELQTKLTPPPPPPTTAATRTGSGYEHVVQPGQSLSVIAKEYKSTVAAIMKANNIKDENLIRAGQKLFIPD